jgi:hypothetical protein
LNRVVIMMSPEEDGETNQISPETNDLSLKTCAIDEETNHLYGERFDLSPGAYRRRCRRATVRGASTKYNFIWEQNDTTGSVPWGFRNQTTLVWLLIIKLPLTLDSLVVIRHRTLFLNSFPQIYQIAHFITINDC